MWTAIVVKPDRFVDSTSGLFPGEEGPSEAVLLFQNAIQSLGDRVFCAVVDLAHAHREMTLLEASHVLVAAILTPTVRVVNRVFVVRQIIESVVQRFERLLRAEALSAVVTNNLVRMQVRDQRQVLEILPGPDIGDITDPDLIWIRRFELRNQIPIHRQGMP